VTTTLELEALQQAPGFVALLRGPEHVFAVANQAYRTLVGHRDVIGKTIREALPEIAGQGFYELLDRVYATGEPYIGTAVPITLQRTQGAAPDEAILDFIYQPIRDPDGKPFAILVQGHEVTNMVRAESRYRMLFSAIDDGFCVMQMLHDASGQTIDYRFLEANAAFEQHTGLVNAVGKTALEMVPDLDESWFRIYGEVADTGVAKRFENHAPAMQRWFEVNAHRVGEPAKKLVALVFKDVTLRKQAEAETARALADEKLARRAAEEAGRTRDEFLAIVSHELRTPLTAMLGWVQLLRTESLPPEKQAKALETIERNARAQAQLIEDLLDVSRVIAGQLRIEVMPVEMRPIVEAALETVQPAALARDVRIQPMLATDAIVLGDAARLQQIVWNLVSNAVKFTPRGGHVQVVLRLDESAVELAVSDSGKGIAPDFLPHVFDRFRQAEGATTRSSGGLGLGLSIVRELVGIHGGTVSVASDGVGHGATFKVRLPISASRSREPAPSRLARTVEPALLTFQQQLTCPPDLEGLHVLVVDDDPDTREMLGELFERCKANVTAVSSAAEALAAVRKRVPDLLLSDIGMPGEDGFSLISKVRALPRDAGGAVPAVALTAYARVEDRARALHAGFDNHLTKPVEPVELLAVAASFARRKLR